MEVTFLTPADRKIWDQFASSSDDAWFSHTSVWLDWTREIDQAAFVSDLSFFIKENNEILAIAPLIIEKSPQGNVFGFLKAAAPFPALSKDLNAEKRQKVFSYYRDQITALAEANEVVSAAFKIPSLSRGVKTNALLKLGYFDLPYQTQVVDLSRSEAELWSEIRKGHKADIKKAALSCSVHFWDCETITQQNMDEYRDLHQKDAGRVTRSQKTFDMMRDWVKSGHAVLVEARLNNKAVAFALHITYKGGAYYGSGCKDPDHTDVPASHLIQWESIRWLKKTGYKLYDLGIQWFTPQWFEVPSAKEISISRFKRGFGGHAVNLITAEYFYDKKSCENVMQERLQRYLETFSSRTPA